MAGTKLVEELAIAIKEEEMTRILGYRQSKIPPRVKSILNEVRESCHDLVSPACIYRFMEKEELVLSDYMRGTENAVLCLVTIGPGLETMVEEVKTKGDLTRALVMDTYGSAAAEASADAAEKMISNECLAKGTSCSTRFSPGYGGWDISEQKWILKALEAEKLNVKLTEGCMMIPRKSITFAVNVGKSPGDRNKQNQCEICGLINCRFKHSKQGEKRENE